MTNPYHGDFSCWADVVSNFGEGPQGGGFGWSKNIKTVAGAPAAEPDEVLHASYDYESYEGSAYVVYRQGDKYYTVSGGHCSCCGLEGQWEPEEYDRDILIAALERQNYRSQRQEEVLAVLKGRARG